MMYSSMSVFRIGILACAVLMVGCGGDTKDNAAPPARPPSPDSSMIVMDGFSTVEPNKSTFVDLTPFIRGDNVRITSINNDGKHTECGTPSISGLGVNVDIANSTFCDFKYTVAQSNGLRAVGTLNVLSTEAEEPTLPPLSDAITLDSGPVDFDLEVLLGANWENSYSLDKDNIEVQGQESNLGKATGADNTITFKPPTLSGWNRIVYVLKDSANSQQSVMGVIYVTVSEVINQAPEIEPRSYDYSFYPDSFDKIGTPIDFGIDNGSTLGPTGFANQVIDTYQDILFIEEDHNYINHIRLPIGAEYDGRTFTARRDCLANVKLYNEYEHIGNVNEGSNGDRKRTVKNINGKWFSQNAIDPIYMNDEETIDLSNLSGLDIKDPDGQEWQLISVQSFTAEVTLTDPDSVTNKAFQFSASDVGEHIVSYIIADHYGGYAPGLIRIKVMAKDTERAWTDIDIKDPDYAFIAPITYTSASSEGFNVFAVWDDNAKNTVAGYDESTAKTYCDTLGSLPSIYEMQTLFDSKDKELKKWPKQQPYLVQSGDSVEGYNLVDGTVEPYNKRQSYYVACTLNPYMYLQLTTRNVVANGEKQVVGRVTMPKKDGEFTIKAADASDLTNNEVEVEKNKISDHVQEVSLSSISTGTYKFVVVDDEDKDSTLTSQPVTFIGDQETAVGEMEVPKMYPSGSTPNEVNIKVVDENNNPVSSLWVILTSSDAGDDIKPKKGSPTGPDGRIQMTVTAENVASRTLTLSKKGNGGTEISTLNVTPAERHWNVVAQDETHVTLRFEAQKSEMDVSTDPPLRVFYNIVWFDPEFKLSSLNDNGLGKTYELKSKQSLRIGRIQQNCPGFITYTIDEVGEYIDLEFDLGSKCQSFDISDNVKGLPAVVGTISNRFGIPILRDKSIKRP
ncbi:Ig-like domain-containing protein [Vibrio sp. AND4]|uniref:Ig-like domain-containing protein n=1 Tax=Vibrio sp. AND4 TaxID=314289 RepID=UPI00015F30FF|nr:Ig-like domain-containing protein [Vibrio sp. AND4]EDP60467.1 hypothetical protein AND4_06104 [Vibrio sp. AND4]